MFRSIGNLIHLGKQHLSTVNVQRDTGRISINIIGRGAMVADGPLNIVE
jgi:hypothetical protein